jgi:type I restriction enzyme S subunit
MNGGTGLLGRENYPIVPLEELCDLCSGITKGRKIGSTVTVEVPYMAVANVQDGSLKLDNVKTIEATHEEIHRYRLLPGDLWLTEGGDPDKLGRGAIWNGEITSCIHQNHIFRARKASEYVDMEYLAHLVSSPYGKRYFLRQSKQTTGIASINMGQLKRFPVPLPPLEEQRRIAAILDKATALEDLSAKQSRLLEEAEKHLFLECFGSPFPGKTLWPVAQLGELGSLERGISKHRPRNDPSLMDGPYPFIQTGDVAGCRGKITTFSATYSDKGLAQSRLWPAGTLCITIAANIAKTGILDFDACFPDSVVGFQARNPAIITYVQCWMSFLQGHIEQMAPESAQKNINLEILRGLSVPVPSETALQKFHEAILALRCTLSKSTQRRRRTAELKSSLQSVSFAA